MERTTITPEARRDIQTLRSGVSRHDVALDALEEATRRPELLSPEQVERLKRILSKVSGTGPEAGAQKVIVGGQIALEARITVAGTELVTIMSNGSLGKSLEEQKEYARILDCRVASPDENREHALYLLAREKNNTANSAELEALAIYRESAVRSTQLPLSIGDGDELGVWKHGWDAETDPTYFALFVRLTEEEKRELVKSGAKRGATKSPREAKRGGARGA